MKPIIFLTAAFIVIGLTSCLKSYTCECERSYYSAFKVDSVSKITAEFNGSRKAPVIQDCNNLEDSTRNASGYGQITRCDLK